MSTIKLVMNLGALARTGSIEVLLVLYHAYKKGEELILKHVIERTSLSERTVSLILMDLKYQGLIKETRGQFNRKYIQLTERGIRVSEKLEEAVRLVVEPLSS